MKDGSIDEFALLIPERMLSQSGKVFYSGRAVFTGPKDLYILGLYPGGSPDDDTEDASILV